MYSRRRVLLGISHVRFDPIDRLALRVHKQRELLEQLRQVGDGFLYRELPAITRNLSERSAR